MGALIAIALAVLLAKALNLGRSDKNLKGNYDLLITPSDTDDRVIKAIYETKAEAEKLAGVPLRISLAFRTEATSKNLIEQGLKAVTHSTHTTGTAADIVYSDSQGEKYGKTKKERYGKLRDLIKQAAKNLGMEKYLRTGYKLYAPTYDHVHFDYAPIFMSSALKEIVQKLPDQFFPWGRNYKNFNWVGGLDF